MQEMMRTDLSEITRFHHQSAKWVGGFQKQPLLNSIRCRAGHLSDLPEYGISVCKPAIIYGMIF